MAPEKEACAGEQRACDGERRRGASIIASTFAGKLVDELARGEAFQISQNAGKIRRGQDGVKVMVENHPGVDFEGFVLTAVWE